MVQVVLIFDSKVSSFTEVKVGVSLFRLQYKGSGVLQLQYLFYTFFEVAIVNKRSFYLYRVHKSFSRHFSSSPFNDQCPSYIETSQLV